MGFPTAAPEHFPNIFFFVYSPSRSILFLSRFFLSPKTWTLLSQLRGTFQCNKLNYREFLSSFFYFIEVRWTTWSQISIFPHSYSVDLVFRYNYRHFCGFFFLCRNSLTSGFCEIELQNQSCSNFNLFIFFLFLCLLNYRREGRPCWATFSCWRPSWAWAGSTPVRRASTGTGTSLSGNVATSPIMS